MEQHKLSPREMFASLWRNRYLNKSLIKRDVVGRYKGSFLGILWSFFNPVFMLAVYTFVFSVVFQMRWGVGSDSKTEFALVLFAGLMMYNLFTEAINRAPTLIVSNVNYVKKTVFPLEILPWVALGSSLFHMIISLLVWLSFYTVAIGWPHITVLWVPVVIVPLLFLIVGLSWMLASLGVYLRDVDQVVKILTTVLLFLSPIFYPVSAIPPEYQKFLLLNPLAPVISQMREVLYWGNPPDFKVYAIYLTASLGVAWLGFAWFQKTRKGFADVL